MEDVVEHALGTDLGAGDIADDFGFFDDVGEGAQIVEVAQSGPDLVDGGVDYGGIVATHEECSCLVKGVVNEGKANRNYIVTTNHFVCCFYWS